MLALHSQGLAPCLRVGVLFAALLGGILIVQSANADSGWRNERRGERYSHHYPVGRGARMAALKTAAVAATEEPVASPEPANATTPEPEPSTEPPGEKTVSADVATASDTASPVADAATPSPADPPAAEPTGDAPAEEAVTPAPERPYLSSDDAPDQVEQPDQQRRPSFNRARIRQRNTQQAANVASTGSQQENVQTAANVAVVEQACTDLCMNEAVITQQNTLDAVNVAAPSPLVSTGSDTAATTQANTQVATNEAWVTQVCESWCVNYTFIYQDNVLTGANLAVANAAAAVSQSNTQVSGNIAYVEQLCETYCYNLTIILQSNTQLAANARGQLHASPEVTLTTTTTQTNTQLAFNDVQVVQSCASVCWNSLIVMQLTVQDAMNFLSPAGKV